MGELVLPPHLPCDGVGEEEMPFPLPLITCGRAGLEGMRTNELVPHLTSCSTGESRPCISPGQHKGADPAGIDNGEPALRV